MRAERIDAFASYPHHVDHLAPVWLAMAPHIRGSFHAPGIAFRRAAALGLGPSRGSPKGQRVLVASWAPVGPGKRYAYVEHGAGQSYGYGEPAPDSPPSECSCPVELMLGPGETWARRNRIHHPHARVLAIGCPKMDRYHRTVPARVAGDPMPPLPHHRIGVTWHWPSMGLGPEARPAFPHWKRAIARSRFKERFLGHSHPRGAKDLSRWYRTHGIAWTGDLTEVFDQCCLLVADNTSALYEFSSLGYHGRPVVLLDAPWYRRDVHHGMRFWADADMGLRVGSGEVSELDDAIEESLLSDPRRAERKVVRHRTYADHSGRSSKMAAAALLAWSMS